MELEKAAVLLKWPNGGDTVDLTPAIPFNIGDWRKMKAHGIDVMKLGTVGLDLDQIVNILHYACKKATGNPQFPLSKLEELHLGDPQIRGALDAISGVVERPDPSG